jgi:hypothetical protein
MRCQSGHQAPTAALITFAVSDKQQDVEETVIAR